MRLIVLDNEELLADVTCGREAVYIGSREGCRIQLPESRVASQQAVIYPESGGAWVIQPLDAERELQINGAPIIDKTPLKIGDEVRVSDFIIKAVPEQVEAVGQRGEMGTSVAQFARFAAQSALPVGALIKKLDEPLMVQPAQLTRLGQVNLALATCLTVEDLMGVALPTLQTAFSAQRVWIGVRRVNYGSMEYVEGRTLSGQPAELPEMGERLKPRALDRGQFVQIPMLSPDEPISILVGPIAGPDTLLGMIYMDSGDSGRRFSPHDLDFLMLLSNVFGVQLDAIFREIAQTRAATLNGEVVVAHEIQARLTPRKLPQWEGLQFGAFREPGRERTGDIYDLLRLGNDHAAFMIANTPTTGPLPSMLMAQAHSAFRVAAMHQDAPNVFLRSMNWLLFDSQRDRPLDCFVGELDPANGQLRYSLAGKIGAYIIGQRGEERRLGGSEPLPSLGLVKSVNYPLLIEELQPGETLVLFTSGVTTAQNRKGVTFSEDRFVTILCDGFGQLASQLLKEMLSDLRSFTEGGLQPDDITVILAHRVSD